MNQISENFNAQLEINKMEIQKGPNIVMLNIGGTIFITTKETLLSIQGTTFYVLLSNEKYKPDFEGCFFFDRSPKYFEEILYYLRTNSMYCENFQTSNMLGHGRNLSPNYL
jgi:hypothetical protein